MILKDIRLYLDVDDFDRAQCSKFLFDSCYVSNYLSRNIRGARWDAESYKSILIKCVSRDAVLAYLSPQKNLIVPVEFNLGEYNRLGGADLHESYLSLFYEGFERAALHFPVPFFELSSLIDRFRNGGYKNEWIFKKKKLGDVQLQCSLNCELSRDNFSLFLCVDRRGVTIFQEKILETKPDELIFSHKFKDMKVQDNKIVVLDAFENSIFELPIDGLR